MGENVPSSTHCGCLGVRHWEGDRQSLEDLAEVTLVALRVTGMHPGGGGNAKREGVGLKGLSEGPHTDQWSYHGLERKKERNFWPVSQGLFVMLLPQENAGDSTTCLLGSR